MKEVLCIVHGQVQGVSFRYFALERARRYKLVGYAKNLPDGTVEVVAQGEENILKQFIESISVGPEEAEVESLNVSWGPVGEEKFSAFSVE